MTVMSDGYELDFPDAKKVFKFDDIDKLSPHYHKLQSALSAVDVIAEYDDKDVYVELKGCCDSIGQHRVNPNKAEKKANDWQSILAKKYKDTFLYRYAEDKVGKPIVYICMVNLDAALVIRIHDHLKSLLPNDIKKQGFQHEIIDKLIVINEKSWNSSEVAKLCSLKWKEPGKP